MMDAIKFVAVLGIISIFTRGVQSGVPSGSVSNTAYSDSYSTQSASVYQASQGMSEAKRSYIVDASHLKQSAEEGNNQVCEKILQESYSSVSLQMDAYNNCLAN